MVGVEVNISVAVFYKFEVVLFFAEFERGIRQRREQKFFVGGYAQSAGGKFYIARAVMTAVFLRLRVRAFFFRGIIRLVIFYRIIALIFIAFASPVAEERYVLRAFDGKRQSAP